MKKLITLILLSCSLHGYASHFSLGDLSYTYTGSGNVYELKLRCVLECVSQAIISPSVTINLTSSCFPAQTIAMPVYDYDTIGSYAGMPNGLNTICFNPSSQNLGFVIVTYKTTTALPGACVDWKFSFTNCCRAATITNLAPNGNMYLEATLNNAQAVNSNAVSPNIGGLITRANELTSFRMPTVDPEGDSIAIEWYQPAAGGGLPVGYVPPYSFTNPLGNNAVLTINPAAQTFNVLAPQIGRFALGLLIKEYRNGTMVGSQMKDFYISSLPAPLSSAPAYYAQLALGSLTGSACPGSSAAFNLTFRNEIPNVVSGDSIFVTVTADANAPINAQCATAISDTGRTDLLLTVNVPATLNPAQYPFQVFYLHTYNNRSWYSDVVYPFVLHLAPCVSDSVWSGDANGDFSVDGLDPLAIAVAYGDTGAARPVANTLWQAAYCANWSNSFLSGVNHKHADCNGDGVVDTLDLNAISTNWGSVHQRTSSATRVTSLPDLSFDLTGVNFIPGTTVAVPVRLGANTNPITGCYGLSAQMVVSGVALTNPPSVNYPANSWLGNSNNTLKYASSAGTNAVNWAYARRDHQAVVSGQGILALLTFYIPSSVTSGQTIHLSFQNPHIVDNNLQEISGYNVVDTMVTVSSPLTIGTQQHGNFTTTLFPNPSIGNTTFLQFQGLNATTTIKVTITDAAGRSLWQYDENLSKTQQAIALPELAPGFYSVQVSTEGAVPLIHKWLVQ